MIHDTNEKSNATSTGILTAVYIKMDINLIKRRFFLECLTPIISIGF
jgi:hypothetical protein